MAVVAAPFRLFACAAPIVSQKAEPDQVFVWSLSFCCFQVDYGNEAAWRSVAPLAISVRLLASFQQVGADARAQVAVEHAVNIPDLYLGAVVLHQPVWMQHVGTYLIAEINI